MRVVGTIGSSSHCRTSSLWFIGAFLGDTLGLGVADLTKDGENAGYGIPGIGPTPPKVFSLSWVGLHDVRLNTRSGCGVRVRPPGAAAVLYVVIRRTQVGLQMRAQVDRASLATLRGIDPNRTSGIAWMLSVTLASLAGILIAPLFHLDNSTFVIVVFASLCAVAIAGMRSIPLAFAVGLALGVFQNLVAGYKSDILPEFLNKLTGVDSAIPYVLLLVALVSWVHGAAVPPAQSPTSGLHPITAPRCRRGGASCRGRSSRTSWCSCPRRPAMARERAVRPVGDPRARACARHRLPVIRRGDRHRWHGEPRASGIRDCRWVRRRVGPPVRRCDHPAAVGEVGLRHPTHPPQRPPEFPVGVRARVRSSPASSGR